MPTRRDLLYKTIARPWWMVAATWGDARRRVGAIGRRVGGSVGFVGVDGCVFCDIVAGRESAHLVWRDDVAVAFLDRRPLFHGHTLVVPVGHVVTLPELVDVGPFFERVRRVAAVMPDALDAEGTFVANNNVVSQSVAHLHVHVVPRRKGDGLRGFFWPRQRYDEAAAVDAATRLAEALDANDQG